LLFRVLGGVDVVLPSGHQVAVRSAKQRRLLTALLMNANHWVSLDKLVDALWDDGPPPSAAGNTKTYVWRLRTALVAARIRSGTNGYRIDVARDELDLFRFEDDVRRGHQAAVAHDWPLVERLVSGAIGLWHGEPFADLETPDAKVCRARLGELRLTAQEDLVRAQLALGSHDDAIAELQALVAAHPLRERLRGLLMLALYRSGRQAEALCVYQDFRAVLDQELGLEPGDELTEIQLDILNQAPELRAERGERPVRTRLPGRSAESPPAQLPADISTFVGRDAHLALLNEALADGGTSPWVISGLPGVGKSALAVHWAHRVADRFPDGQLYLDLRGHADGPTVGIGEALDRLLRSLGVPPDQVPADPGERAGVFRSVLARRRMLIVLDNANDSGQVRALLPGHQGCLVLVTSRNELRGLVALNDARSLSLGVLREDETIGLLRRIVGARRVDQEPAAARRLCSLCGHLPLAIRIAAANLSSRPHHRIGHLADRLASGNPMEALAVGTEPGMTVRAAFDLSYLALPTKARILFQRLALVPGADFSAEVAAVLCDDDQGSADHLLDVLCAAHLVDHYAPHRYRFHDLLRAYGVERAGEGGQAEVADRVLRFYVRTATAAVAAIDPDARLVADRVPTRAFTVPAALEWLDAEASNLVAAMAHAAEHGPARHVWPLADALRAYFRFRGHGPDRLPEATAGLNATTGAPIVHKCDRHPSILFTSMIGGIDPAVGS
jgi:DNA-binding SARP family transcriptional activator